MKIEVRRQNGSGAALSIKVIQSKTMNKEV
jgi:hypothetical protein